MLLGPGFRACWCLSRILGAGGDGGRRVGLVLFGGWLVAGKPILVLPSLHLCQRLLLLPPCIAAFIIRRGDQESLLEVFQWLGNSMLQSSKLWYLL